MSAREGSPRDLAPGALEVELRVLEWEPQEVAREGGVAGGEVEMLVGQRGVQLCQRRQARVVAEWGGASQILEIEQPEFVHGSPWASATPI